MLTEFLNGFSLQLQQPLWLLAVLPLVVLIVWQWRRRRNGLQLQDSGLDYLLDAGFKPADTRQRWRLILVSLITVLAGLTWAAPQIRTSTPWLSGLSRQIYPAFLVAMDVSGSMTEPLGGYVINGQLNTGGATRFEGAREQLYSFVARHAESQFGLVLFSVQPMLVRWPTLHTAFDFHDVLDEGMRYTNPGRKRASQLARFAGGTSTRDGLALARDVLIRQEATGRSLILVADLIDNTEEVIEGIRDLPTDDIYTHILAVDPEQENLDSLSGAFHQQKGIYVYTVRSNEDLAAAFESIEKVEADRQGETGSRQYVQDLRWLTALAGFLLAVLTVILFETRLHKTDR